MAVTLSVAIAQNSQSVANNTSNVTVTVTASWTGGSFNQTKKSGTCVINGVTYNFTSSFNTGRSTTGSQTLYTKTLDIAHNADGTKTLAASASYVTGVSSGTITASTSKALTTIPRATTPTLSAYITEMGKSVTISTPRASSSFTHTLTYKFGGASGTIGTGIATSKAWTIPLTLANQVPNAAGGTGTITCITYNGSTKIGEKSITFVTTVPDSVVPTISTVATSDPTGNLAKYSDYVQNKSTVKATVTASGAYSSTIKSYSIVMNGTTYTANGSTSAVLKTVGTNTIKATVTDSRGRTATKSVTINVIAYSMPTISAFTLERCDENGTVNEDGAFMKATFNAAITPLNDANSKSVTLEYKETNSSTWNTAETYSSYTLNTSKVMPANVDLSYNVKLTLADDFSTTAQTKDIGTSFTLMDFRSTGKGVAIGKVSEKDAFECNLDTEFKNVRTISGADLDSVRGVYYTLVSEGSVTGTTFAKINTFNGRKFSDYPDSSLLIAYYLPNGATYCRTIILGSIYWIGQRPYNTMMFYSSGAQYLDFHKISDTQIECKSSLEGKLWLHVHIVKNN